MIFKIKIITIIITVFIAISALAVTNLELIRLAEERSNLLRSLSFSAAYSEIRIKKFDDLRKESYVAEHLDLNSKYLPIFKHPNILIEYSEEYVTVREEYKYPVSLFRWKELSHSSALPPIESNTFED